MFHKRKMAGAVSTLLTGQNRRVRGTLFNGFAVQMNEHRGFLVADPVNLARGYLYFATRKPVTDFDDQLADGPSMGIHHEVGDVADDPIGGLEMVAAH